MYDISPAAKMLFKAGDTRKEYRFNVLNDDGTTDFTINNETLVAESVAIDERMASTSELRFGLCEGASLEFQYFDHPNIKGRRLNASIRVYYELENPSWRRYGLIAYDRWNPEYTSMVVNDTRPIRVVIPAHTPGELALYSGASTTRKKNWIIDDSANEQIIQNISEFESGDTFRYYFTYYGWSEPDPVEVQYYMQYGAYQVLMGHFTVSGCAKQVSTGIYKVTAYNKLKSEYLDARANELLTSQYAATTSILVADIERTLLKDYLIKNDIDIPASSVTGVTGTDSFYLNIPFLFTALYGIEAPINAKEYSICRTPSLSNPLYFGFESYAATYETTGYNDWIISELAGKMEDFEKNVKKRIEYLIDSAVLQPGSYDPIPHLDDIIHGREFASYLLSRDYWKYICCIEVTQAGETKRYSTAIWNSEVYHQTTHTVAGTFNDLIGKTQYGPATIKVITPYCMNMRGFEDEQTATTVDYCFGSQQSFMYYTNAQQDTAYIDVPPIKYGDGVTDYEASLPEYNIDEAMRVGYPLYSKAEKHTVDLTADLADFTLRDILTADYETQCMFGQLTRSTDRFRGVDLNGGGLYPAETLYPANNKYPNETPLKKGIHPYPNEYMQLWTDDTEERTFRNLYITYKNGDDEYVLEKEINADGNTDYYVADNWLFRNLHWSTSDVNSIAEDMASKMQNIRWVPFQMELAGLPYVEAGDAIEIVYRDGITRNSYILQRQLSGIQNLQDTYASGQLDIF